MMDDVRDRLLIRRDRLRIREMILEEMGNVLGNIVQGGKVSGGEVSGGNPGLGFGVLTTFGDLLSYDSVAVRIGIGAEGSQLDVVSGYPTWVDGRVDIVLEFDDGGTVLADQTREIYTDMALSIQAVTLWAPAESGDATVDILTNDYASLPTLASITGGSPATLSGAQTAQPSISGWTTAVVAGTGWQFSLSGVTSLTKLVVAVSCVRS